MPAPAPPSRPEGTATERFRRQHEELYTQGMEILTRLRRETIATEAGEVRKQIARFAGRLRVHAAMEDQALYPRLLHHAEARVREQALALQAEVAGIYASFDDYERRWPSVETILGDPRAFIRETREVLRVLAMRMMRENDELYPLVDAAD
jgi:hypothetical protein